MKKITKADFNGTEPKTGTLPSEAPFGFHPAPKAGPAADETHGKFGGVLLCARCGAGVVFGPGQTCTACRSGWTPAEPPARALPRPWRFDPEQPPAGVRFDLNGEPFASNWNDAEQTAWCDAWRDMRFGVGSEEP